MKTNKLKKGLVYKYTSQAESVNVMYTGYSFCPSVGGGYGFRGYNEASGQYDGYFNTLSRRSVETLISEL